MKARKLDWSILAQCDGFAVQRLIETAERPAMKAVTPMRESSFERKLKNEIKWRDMFETVSNAYKNLSPNFEIVHDQFGGYRLIYRGSNVLKPSSILRQNPVGFVAVVPDGAVTDLSIMSSERTGEQLLLLGPIRFVNSDCEPNCDYDFSGDYGTVQLRVKRRINPGEELFVKCGAEVFEKNSCLCRTCKIRENGNLNSVFAMLIDELINEVAEYELDNNESQLFESPICH